MLVNDVGFLSAQAVSRSWKLTPSLEFLPLVLEVQQGLERPPTLELEEPQELSCHLHWSWENSGNWNHGWSYLPWSWRCVRSWNYCWNHV